MTPETRFAKSPNGRIAYQVIGEGPLDLIFRPDPMVNLENMWEEPNLARFLRNLASFSRLICFDHLGYGVSDPIPPAGKQTAAEFAEDFEFVMQAARSERAAVFGHGTVGRTALCSAAWAPERTSALILCDTSPCLSRQPDYPCGMPNVAFDKLIEDVPLVKDGKLLPDRMQKERVDEDDVMEAAARASEGLERLEQVKYAILERTGHITIVPK